MHFIAVILISLGSDFLNLSFKHFVHCSAQILRELEGCVAKFETVHFTAVT
jgi:hypothetical protein